MIERIQTKDFGIAQKSLLILGPRQVGKTTLIRGLKPDLEINLAKESVYADHVAEPRLLEDLIERGQPKTVFIDEIQRIPSLLNTVQSLLDEDRKLKFYLSGSSARKLKRGSANLLPGRVLNKQVFPISLLELGNNIQPEHFIKYGFLPALVEEKDESLSKEILMSYSANYLREEIQQEALTRNISGYSRFLKGLAPQTGIPLDYSKLGQRLKLPRMGVPRFFEILEDTLLGMRIYTTDQFEDSDQIKHPKFYFFDNGVLNGIERNFDPRGPRRGVLCETIVLNQLMAIATLKKKTVDISYYRTRAGTEVDFIVKLDGAIWALEVKSSDQIIAKDLAGLLSLSKRTKKVKRQLLHFGKKSFKIEGIWCIPWAEGLLEIC